MHSKTKDFEEVYKLLSKRKDPIYTWVIKQFRNKVKEKINILYVGCGYGLLGYKIANLSRNFNVMAIDKINQKDWWSYLKSKTRYNNLNFLSKNIKSFKSDIKFDYAISIKVLHYILVNKKKVLINIFNNLKLNGILYLVEARGDNFFDIIPFIISNPKKIKFVLWELKNIKNFFTLYFLRYYVKDFNKLFENCNMVVLNKKELYGSCDEIVFICKKHRKLNLEF